MILNFLKRVLFEKKNRIEYEKKVLQNINSNEIILSSLNFDISKIKKILKENNLEYSNPRLSWHYHIFTNYASDQKLNILEIGTYDGTFTNFLSKIFRNSEITSIDLPDNNYDFIETYNRNNSENLNELIKKRTKNLQMTNINFLQIDSFYLFENFINKKFDFIFIDGDHLNPQVTIDIFQSIKLLKANGIMIVDDIVKNLNNVFNSIDTDAPYTDSQSYFTLERLKKRNLIESSYILKYTFPKKFENKYKYLSVTKHYNG